jgi:glycine/D-amino acid oxidase-like deaminating enzyme
VDPNAIGSGATNLSYGSLCLLDQTPAQFTLTRYGLALWDKLVQFLPPDCEYRRCGTIWLAFDQKQAQELLAKGDVLNRQGIRAEYLNPRQIAEAEPGVSPVAVGGLLLPNDSWLRASRAAEFLFQLAAKKGARHLRQQVTGIANHALMLNDGSSLFAGNVINAAGNDAPAITAGTALTYVKSHILVVESQAVCARHQLSAMAAEQPPDVEGQVRFVAYQKETAAGKAAEVWLGSSVQPVSNPSASLQVEPKLVACLLRRAIEIIPAIGHAHPLRSWTGLRARTADGLPLIGRTGENLFAAAGHNAYGATAALATAKLIAAELLCQTPEIDPKPFLPDRFKKDQSLYAKQT